MEKLSRIFTVPMIAGVLGTAVGCADDPACVTPTCREDMSINTDVRARLDQHPGLSPAEIRVSTRNQVVSLYGVVDNEMERQAVQDIVANASNVTGVINLLGVNNK